ncbi:MAG: transglycosylase SLT domain-containing protein [Syntrophotalea acetylenica]|nr:transglycosylase SLT domain-containing protein [Syntrophotalea acetylenica]
MKSMIALALALCFLPFGGVKAQEPPPALVKAIARQESGLNPLAVNVAGKSYYPATREEAERLIREAIAAGKSFDVGRMQINSWWMNRFGIDPVSLLDPDVNEAWGKRILAEEIGFIRFERTFDKMKGHGVQPIIIPLSIGRSNRHVHKFHLPRVRPARLRLRSTGFYRRQHHHESAAQG